MKIKTTIAVLTASMVAIGAFGQGEVTMQNTLATPVLDSTTGAAVALGVAKAGLYYTTDLGAVPSVNEPLDDWILVEPTADVTPIAQFAGVYVGGQLPAGTPLVIPGVDQGTDVLVQVRAWSAAYTSYADAWANAAATPLVGASNVMQVQLGGGSLPIPNLSTVVEGFTMTPVPEPSTIALGLLGGLGAMLLLRRRK
jgi:hypothetical protein